MITEPERKLRNALKPGVNDKSFSFQITQGSFILIIAHLSHFLFLQFTTQNLNSERHHTLIAHSCPSSLPAHPA